MFHKTKLALWVMVLVALLWPGLTWAADPNLLAQYWFDDGEGFTVWDETGNGRDGQFNGAVSWSVPGVIGACLQFSGGTVDILDNVDDLQFGNRNVSLTAWIRTIGTDQVFYRKVTSGVGNNFAFGVGGTGLAGVTYRNMANIYSTVTVNDDEWHHFGFVQDRNEETFAETWMLYIDGVLDVTQGTDIPDDNGQGGVFLGQGDTYLTGNWSGYLDELYVYGSVLDAADIPFVMDGASWKPRARTPQPADGATISGTAVDLAWEAGWAETATGEQLTPDSHDVYLSTDPDAVAEARAEALVANVTDTSYTATDLELDAVYYWRIDEVNDTDPNSPWTGMVWRFTVPSLAAKDPMPADDAKFRPVTQTLQWTPGIGATSHVVYIGNAYDEVDNATSGSVTVTEARYAPEGLQAAKVYYWRVDEVNSETFKGPVWKFSTVPVADGDHIDPNLFAWWKLDEGEGRTVVDYSGYGHHAAFAEDPVWDVGIFGSAVRVWDGQGLGYVKLPDMPDFNSPEVTLCGWIYQDNMIPAWNQFIGTSSGSGSAGIMQVNGNMRYNYPQPGYQWNHGWDVDSGLALPVGEWAFIALSVDPDGASYYVNNNTFRRDASHVPFTVLAAGNYLGRDLKKGPGASLQGRLDDWRIYTKALSADELKEVMRGEPWLAWDPQPGNGVPADVIQGSTLSWQAGDGAAQHDVFVALDLDALQNADVSDSSGVYRGRQALDDTTYDLSAEIQPLVTYYWRIDEVQADGSIRRGNPWRFTTVDYLIIDDFEAYTNDADALERVFQTWIDGVGYSNPEPGVAGNGTGAAMGHDIWSVLLPDSTPNPYYNGDLVETTIVSSGSQSGPMYYDGLSEIVRTYDEAQDWGGSDEPILSLMIYGDPNNTIGQMYVKVNDTRFDYEGDAGDIQAAEWLTWNTNLTGVTLVNSMTIGVTEGSGVLYIDDIRLYLEAPVEEPMEPEEPEVPDPNVIVPSESTFLIANFDADGTGDNWVNGFGSGGRYTARALSADTPDGSEAAMQIDIDYSAGGWGSAWGAFAATGLGPQGASALDASAFNYCSFYAKSTIDGASINLWFEEFPGPTQGYVNQVTASGIGTEWAYYEVALDTAVAIRDGLHDMTKVNRMSFGGPNDLGAPYSVMLDQLMLITDAGEGMLQ